jgi:hypothetical protein
MRQISAKDAKGSQKSASRIPTRRVSDGLDSASDKFLL